MFAAARFYWLCIKHAWRGCWTRANELATVLGGGILFAGLYYFSPWLREKELIEAPSTIWGAVGFAVACAAASLIIAFLVIFVGRMALAPARLYWIERDKVDVYNRRATSQFFKLANTVYSESHSIKWASDQKEAEFFETVFYLGIGNGLESGRTLKRTQARIFHFGEPVIARVKETGGGEIDIRHGEWALFEIGRIVSKEVMGMYQGQIIVDDAKRRSYEHNIPQNFLSFEIRPAFGGRGYGLAHRPEQSHVWSFLLVISADDALAMQVRISVDMTKSKDPVSYEPTEDIRNTGKA